MRSVVPEMLGVETQPLLGDITVCSLSRRNLEVQAFGFMPEVVDYKLPFSIPQE
jgi:hypothetical protein